MRKLVIVESPSKSKTIQKYLGNDFEVVSSKGHIRDLSTKGKGGLGVDLENGFKPTYTINKDKTDVVKQLKAKAKGADAVYLATDPDREGEAISWHLAEELGLTLEESNRVVFNEITSTAVKAAFEHPRQVDMDLVRSQETRRILDRIIGFRLSTLLQRKIGSKSAGRVQSVALKLIVEKENEIKAFIPEEKWTIKAEFEKDAIEFSAELSKYQGKTLKLKTQADNDAVMSRLTPFFTVTSIEEKTGAKAHKFPFTTSTLQQEAANKLSFAAKKTMRVAQKLYEGIALKDGQEGIITYMRTDSTRLSEGFVQEAQAHILTTYGKDYVGHYKVKQDDNSQDAHEAVRPAHIGYTPESLKEYLSPDEYKLYALIYARTLASLMSSPKTKTITAVLSQSDYDFVAKGTKLEFDGYLKVYQKYESQSDSYLPKLEKDEVLESRKTTGTQSFSNPPLRYSEARLIDAMEQKGIGRPSTYATIIDTIESRGYVTLEKAEGSKTKVFVPTEQGFLTTNKLDEYFTSVINVDYTAKMEGELDQIAEAKLDSLKALEDFYEQFKPLYDAALSNMEKIQPVKTGRICPECGGELVQRKGKYGPFVACANYPKCKFVEKTASEDKKEPEYTGENCPDCGKPLIRRMSRFGRPFVGCSGYPSCKFIQKDASAKTEEPTGELCPQCGKPLVKKMGRFGPFVACSNYPSCKYIQPRAKKQADNE